MGIRRKDAQRCARPQGKVRPRRGAGAGDGWARPGAWTAHPPSPPRASALVAKQRGFASPLSSPPGDAFPVFRCVRGTFPERTGQFPSAFTVSGAGRPAGLGRVPRGALGSPTVVPASASRGVDVAVGTGACRWGRGRRFSGLRRPLGVQVTPPGSHSDAARVRTARRGHKWGVGGGDAAGLSSPEAAPGLCWTRAGAGCRWPTVATPASTPGFRGTRVKRGTRGRAGRSSGDAGNRPSPCRLRSSRCGRPRGRGGEGSGRAQPPTSRRRQARRTTRWRVGRVPGCRQRDRQKS